MWTREVTQTVLSLREETKDYPSGKVVEINLTGWLKGGWRGGWMDVEQSRVCKTDYS